MFDVTITALAEALRPKNHGSPVNAHVVPSVQERGPDFAAMNRAIKGGMSGSTDKEPPRATPGREISEKR